MKKSKEDEEEKLSLIDKHIFELEKCLESSMKNYENDSFQFCQKEIFKMGSFIRIYSDLMKTIGAQIKEDVLSELEIIEHNTDKNFSQRLECLFKRWNEFLEFVEMKV